ncbi:gamma-interferon-inducible lysosomal thiol reductase-like isoform X1 [Macrobrachium rosenbergii]|uniref:gamma-interferon-inducible lysosomal thiol reductase-like isoform X1 n=1 Tax=Macrobrachium rosenbergii TaxID=79674 RepID=UPI0034D645E1
MTSDTILRLINVPPPQINVLSHLPNSPSRPTYYLYHLLLQLPEQQQQQLHKQLYSSYTSQRTPVFDTCTTLVHIPPPVGTRQCFVRRCREPSDPTMSEKSSILAVFGGFCTHVPLLLLCVGALCVSPASALPGNSTAPPRVKVTVYYESLCPTSRSFFVNQLYPTWRILSGIMEVDLNAYGKATDTTTETSQNNSNGDFLCQCQHGPQECQGNKLLTCARKYLPDEGDLVDFSHCVMDQYTGLTAGRPCADRLGIDYTALEACVQSHEGGRLLHEVGIKQSTLLPRLNYVPWILIDDVYTPRLSLESERNLKGVVCNTYQGPSPAECP